MFNSIFGFIPYFKKSWKNIEYFDEGWKNRIEYMAQFIKINSTVIDLGCGKMWLKSYLPDNCIYIPVDYISRGPGCMLCDFNKCQFPDSKADVAFVSGCLEYIINVEWFIDSICSSCHQCVISYCTTNQTPNLNIRKKRLWVNNYSEDEIVSTFRRHNFHGSCVLRSENSIFVFERNNI